MLLGYSNNCRDIFINPGGQINIFDICYTNGRRIICIPFLFTMV